MIKELSLKTGVEDFHDITRAVAEVVRESGITEGTCLVYCPHTTAGITINENADPDVVTDLLYGLGQAYPESAHYRHAEGNSKAHLKASAVGSSITVPIIGGRLLLGTWQAIFFCEFDGPRSRRYVVCITSKSDY